MGVVYIVLTIAAGLFFYRLRGLHPFAYGVAEVLVATCVIFLTFYPPEEFLTTDNYSLLGVELSRVVGIFAGIYIFVRGMDNMEKDLPRGWHRWWERRFPKLTSPAP